MQHSETHHIHNSECSLVLFSAIFKRHHHFDINFLQYNSYLNHPQQNQHGRGFQCHDCWIGTIFGWEAEGASAWHNERGGLGRVRPCCSTRSEPSAKCWFARFAFFAVCQLLSVLSCWTVSQKLHFAFTIRAVLHLCMTTLRLHGICCVSLKAHLLYKIICVSLPIMDLAQNCATQSQQQNETAISAEAVTGHQVSDNAPFALDDGFAPIPKKLVEKMGIRRHGGAPPRQHASSGEVGGKNRHRIQLQKETQGNSRHLFLGSMLCNLRCYTCMKSPEKVKDLLVYLRLIMRESKCHGGDGCMSYDTLFCQQAAANPKEFQWASLNQTLYATTILAMWSQSGSKCLKSDHSESQYALALSGSSSSSTTQMADRKHATFNKNKESLKKPYTTVHICCSWNTGCCAAGPGCKYQHICLNAEWGNTSRSPARNPMPHSLCAADLYTCACIWMYQLHALNHASHTHYHVYNLHYIHACFHTKSVIIITSLC